MYAYYGLVQELPAGGSGPSPPVVAAMPVGVKLVRVIAGTGTTGTQQINITGASGGHNWAQWGQLTAAQFVAGPTGQFPTYQAMNTGSTGPFRRVQIVGYLGPS